MAAIFPRFNLDGTTSWRVQIRRKGLKSFITCFMSKEDAEEFVKKYEPIYVLNPEEFKWDHLRQKRENEFCRLKE